MSNINAGYSFLNNGVMRLVGAGYAIYNTNEKSDDVSENSWRFYSYCLNGFDGAFAAKAIEDYVPVVLEWFQPLKYYVIDAVIEKASMLSRGIASFFMDRFIPLKQQEMLVNETLKLFFTVYETFGRNLETALLIVGGLLFLAYMVRKEKMKAMIEDSQYAQMASALLVSFFTARVAGYFNTTLVNLAFVIVLARRKSPCIKKLTDRFFVKPIGMKCKRLYYQMIQEIKLAEIEGKEDKKLKHRIFGAFLKLRSENDFVRDLTNPLVAKKIDKAVDKKLGGSGKPKKLPTPPTKGQDENKEPEVGNSEATSSKKQSKQWSLKSIMKR